MTPFTCGRFRPELNLPLEDLVAYIGPIFFEDIEKGAARVSTCHPNAAHGIAGALEEAAAPHAEITGILLQQRRQDSLGHHVLIGLVSERGQVTFCKGA